MIYCEMDRESIKAMGQYKKTTKYIFLVIWVFSFFVVLYFDKLDLISVFFLIVSIVLGCIVSYKEKTVFENLYNSTKKRVIIWFISAIFAFLLFGRSLFMEQLRMQIDFYRVIGFLVLTIALFPITPGILIILKRIEKKDCSFDASHKSIKMSILCGILAFFILVLFSLGYYPCTMTNDSISHWKQAIGKMELTDYSPIAFLLILRGLFTLIDAKTPYIFVIFQILILSTAIGDFAGFLYRKGFSKKVLMIGTGLFAICPSTYMLCLYLSKNPLTAILNLWFLISLAEVLSEPVYYLNRPLWYIKTIISASTLYLIRDNNIVIIIPAFMICIWFIVKYKYLGLRFLTVFGGILCIIGAMQGVVYKCVDYKHEEKRLQTNRPLLAPVGSAIYQNLDIPDDIMEVVERVLPEEEWKKRYDPFNSDLITWGHPKPQYAAISLGEAMGVYFKMLFTYPDIVIKDRLDGANLVWDVRAEMERYSQITLGDVEFKNITLQGRGILGKISSGMKKVSSVLLSVSTSFSLFDIFIWKNGIFIYLLLVVVFYLVSSKKGSMVWAIAPSVFILLTYVLVIAWQSYFYLWFFPLSVVALLIISITESNCYLIYSKRKRMKQA